LGALAFFVVAGWLLASTMQSQDAHAEGKKITGSGKATALLSETKILPGDDPNHAITFLRRLDTDMSDQFGNGQASVVNVADEVAGTGPHRGYRSVTVLGGDQSFAAYEGVTKTVAKSGGPPEVTFQGKWWYTGGTGRFTGIKGGGTYTGQLTPAGLSYEYHGEYELKQ
jgi:hypothetical protein